MELVVFLVTAAIAVVAALAMVASRNAVHSALFLIVNFGAIAVLFLLLSAPFIAVVQVTVYAGAIMVLFVFVILLLGAERSGAVSHRLRWQRPVALLLSLVLLIEAMVVVGVKGSFPQAVARLGAPYQVGQLLFTDYLLPFEIASVLLLIAMVGAVVLTKRRL